MGSKGRDALPSEARAERPQTMIGQSHVINRKAGNGVAQRVRCASYFGAFLHRCTPLDLIVLRGLRIFDYKPKSAACANKGAASLIEAWSTMTPSTLTAPRPWANAAS